MAKCKLPRASHSHFYIPPRKLWRWSTSSTDILHSIFLAMSTTSTPVKEFSIEPLDEDICLAAGSFKMIPRQVSRAAAVLSNLTKLSFSLTHRTPVTPDESVFQDMQIAKALSSACNLEVLFIQADFANVFDVFGVTGFEAIFHGCRFSKLKTLYLFALDAQVQEVMHFLGHIEKLEHLAMDCCELKSGLWSDLAEWTRTYGHLKYASFDQLYGGFGEVDVIEWVRSCRSTFVPAASYRVKAVISGVTKPANLRVHFSLTCTAAMKISFSILDRTPSRRMSWCAT